jgi:hypothetical protein
MKSVLSLSLFFACVLHTIAQNFPVFIGRNTPPVPQPVYNVQGQFGNSNPVQPPIPTNHGMPLGQQRGPIQQQSEPWAPGEPEWFFPGRPQQWLNSCQRRYV